VLDAFERQGWPERVADPLPAESGVDYAAWLRNTVKNLNRGLGGIKFHADGTKHGIRWEPVG
jgi:hypothetical protein